MKKLILAIFVGLLTIAGPAYGINWDASDAYEAGFYDGERGQSYDPPDYGFHESYDRGYSYGTEKTREKVRERRHQELLGSGGCYEY